MSIDQGSKSPPCPRPATTVDHHLDSAKTILIRCPNWVGDIVMATPVFECFRNHFPNVTMIALVKRYARGIIEDSPWFDHIIACNDKTVAGFMETVRCIRAFHPDAAVLLPNSMRSFLTVRLGGVKYIYGYKRDLRNVFLTAGPEPIRTKTGFAAIPMVDYYAEICRHLGLSLTDTPKPRLYISDEVQKKGDERLTAYGVTEEDLLIGLNPGASFGSSKCWPASHFARLAELIQEGLGAKIMVFGGPGEEPIARAIVEKSRAAIINTVPDKIDLAHLKPLIKRCDLLVTNDTGPRQYAVAFDVPVVVLMGPTNPSYTAANLERTRVIREELDCSPCHEKVCPTDHRCMKDISPEKIVKEVRDLLIQFRASA